MSDEDYACFIKLMTKLQLTTIDMIQSDSPKATRPYSSARDALWFSFKKAKELKIKSAPASTAVRLPEFLRKYKDAGEQLKMLVGHLGKGVACFNSPVADNAVAAFFSFVGEPADGTFDFGFPQSGVYAGGNRVKPSGLTEKMRNIWRTFLEMRPRQVRTTKEFKAMRMVRDLTTGRGREYAPCPGAKCR